MSEEPGVAEKTNSFLLPPEVRNNVAAPSTTKDTIRGTKPHKTGAAKTWYGWLQGWWHGQRKVLGCIDVIKTGKLRVNLHVKVYERGKWPYFKQDYLLEEFMIQIPTSMLADINKEIKEYYHVRTEKKPSHAWMKKRYAR